MSYKEDIITQWTQAGGLITKATAAKILNICRSAISNRKDITIYKVGNDEFVSFTEIINRRDIKPRKKRSQK